MAVAQQPAGALGDMRRRARLSMMADRIFNDFLRRPKLALMALCRAERQF
jgi:hypothetical protein